MTINRLHYSHATETGALFHMIGALSQYRKGRPDRDRRQPRGGGPIFESAIAVLDRETRI